MSDLSNIGHAILIIGSIYLHFVYGLDIIITILLCLLAILTWAYAGFTDERKEWFKAYIRMLEAKAEYYRRKTE